MGRLTTASIVALLAALICWAQPAAAEAPETARRDAEIEQIKARLAQLEAEREQTQSEGFLDTVDISGNVTFIGQGTVGNDPGDKTGANVSADLVISAKPTATSTIGFHFDMARGSGISTLPGFEVGRFESTLLGGPNADLEFNSDIPHLIEAWYEPSFLDERIVATFGILDPTVYFDTNEFANDENFQFLADVFVNNPGIDWGGDANGYGPGIRLTVSPTEWFDLSLGGFATQTVETVGGPGGAEQDEVIGFENEFDQPFGILEADFRAAPLGRQGNYRFYAWYNANENNFEEFQTGKRRASWGGGGSFDQMLTDGLGAFLRWSKQDGSIRELEWSVSGGLSALGPIPARPEDVAAIGYAVGLLSDEFRDANPGLRATEQWLEAYYAIQATPNFFFTPDVQYVMNAGGQDQDFFIWGFRAQAVF